MPSRRPKLRELLATVADRGPVLIVTHDNPDPDALASAAGLRALFQQQAGVKADIAYGGNIGRSENRALVDVLGLRVKPLAECRLDRYPVTAIVDFQHTAGNHSLPAGHVPDIAIDHHPVKRGSRAPAFTDYRSRIGATTTIVCQYLFAAKTKIDSTLATALTYGIKSETRDLARATQTVDVKTYVRLYPLADKRRLAQIEMAPVDSEYYAVLARALGNARRYGDHLVVTDLGDVPNGDMAAEMADIFLRLEGLRCAVVLARFGDQLIASVRTLALKYDAGEMIQRAFDGRGSAGGHAGMAAGRVPLDGRRGPTYATLVRDVTRGFRREFGATAGPGRRLVPAP